MAKTKTLFTYGDRVRLKPNRREGWVEQFGTVQGEYDERSDTYVVSLDTKYRDGRHDDGLREVESGQLEASKVNHGQTTAKEKSRRAKSS